MYKRLARAALHSLGIVGGLRRLTANRVRILMYHRFGADTRGLVQQCEHIRRHYNPVSLQDLAANYDAGRPLPPKALVITVDDGYRDFLTCAHPVLHRFGIPATVFLVSDFLDGKLWMWWDTLQYAMDHTARKSLTFTAPDGSVHEFGLTTPAERKAAHAAICTALTNLSTENRGRILDQIAGTLGIAPPSTPPDNYAPLTWDDVRLLAGQHVEFGAHTRTHPILSTIADRGRLHDEIMSSKKRIESEVQQSVIHFCYPNGRRRDFTDEAVDIVQHGGFQTAVTTEPGLNVPGSPRFLLRRLGVDPNCPMPYFEELLAGARTA
jgi:peptidoglycan/xylan/chitin deacetylase (PgdA/CDA1 family)